MKKTLLLLTLITILVSCSKDNDKTTKELYKEPTTNWGISKQQVKNFETRILTGDHDSTYFINNNAPGGLLVYAGENEIVKKVEYYFTSTTIKLNSAVVFFVNNDIVLNQVKDFLVNKYGTYYEIDYNGNYIWKKGNVKITFTNDPTYVTVIYINN